MTIQLRMALASVLAVSGGAQAACTIGGEPVAQVSVTTQELPVAMGNSPANSVRLTSFGQIPVIQGPSNAFNAAPLAFSNSANTPPPPPPPEPGGGNRCDSYRTSTAAGTGGPQGLDPDVSYLQRTPIARGLYRHLIEFNLSQVVDNPKSSLRSHWPLAAWRIPMNNGTESDVVTLRVDYVGLPASPDPAAKRSFQVYWQDVLIGEVPTDTFTPELELAWSADGRMLLQFDVGEFNGDKVSEFVLASSQIQNFQPELFQFGRVAMPAGLRSSRGSVYAYSHLIESPRR